MNLETQFKIINDTNLQRYIRQNSYWYKILNREPEKINLLTQEMKDKYKLNAGDKMESFANNLRTISMLINAFK